MPEATENDYVKCAYCKGLGWDNRSQGQCPACGGVGKFIVQGPWVKCSYCKGLGWDNRTQGPCPTCGGKGNVW